MATINISVFQLLLLEDELCLASFTEKLTWDVAAFFNSLICSSEMMLISWALAPLFGWGAASGSNRDLQIGLRVRDWVRVRLFNSSFLASHYHDTYPFHPMSYSLYLKPTWRTRALETSLVWNSQIVLVLNLVLVVQSEGPCCLGDGDQEMWSISGGFLDNGWMDGRP